MPGEDRGTGRSEGRVMMTMDGERFRCGSDSLPPRKRLQRSAESPSPAPCMVPAHPAPYLVGAGNSQFVEHREEDLRADDHHKEVGEGKDAKNGPKTVDLGGGAQDSDGWHEASGEGQRHGHCGHSAAAHQEVLGGLLAAPSEGVVDADGGRDDQHAREHHVVPHHEGADAAWRVHGRTVAWALRANWWPRGAQPEPGAHFLSPIPGAQAWRPAGTGGVLQVSASERTPRRGEGLAVAPAPAAASRAPQTQVWDLGKSTRCPECSPGEELEWPSSPRRGGHLSKWELEPPAASSESTQGALWAGFVQVVPEGTHHLNKQATGGGMWDKGQLSRLEF